MFSKKDWQSKNYQSFPISLVCYFLRSYRTAAFITLAIFVLIRMFRTGAFAVIYALPILPIMLTYIIASFTFSVYPIMIR